MLCIIQLYISQPESIGYTFCMSIFVKILQKRFLSFWIIYFFIDDINERNDISKYPSDYEQWVIYRLCHCLLPDSCLSHFWVCLLSNLSWFHSRFCLLSNISRSHSQFCLLSNISWSHSRFCLIPGMARGRGDSRFRSYVSCIW